MQHFIVVREIVGIVASVQSWSNVGMSTPTFPPTTNLVAHRLPTFILAIWVTVEFLLLQYSAVCTVDSLSLFYLLFYLDLYVLGDNASIS